MAVMLLASLTMQAQVTFYKIEDGKKIPVKDKETVEIPLDANREWPATINYVVEVDLAAFQKKHKYDNMRVHLFDKKRGYTYAYVFENNRHSANVYMKFSDPVFKKKYSDAKVLEFYLFKPDNASPNSFTLVKSRNFNGYYDNEVEALDLQIFVEGGYIKGEEDYYVTEERAWRKRDILSEFEVAYQHPTQVKFKYTDNYLLNTAYANGISPGKYNSINYNKTGELILALSGIDSKLKETIGKVEDIVNAVGAKVYKQIPEAINIVAQEQKKLILAETDKQKALDMLYQWNQQYLFLMVLDMEDSAAKALNKELKSVTDPKAIFELFKKHNPTPKKNK